MKIIIAVALGILILSGQALAQDRWIMFAAIMVCPTPFPGNCPALATGAHAKIVGETSSYYQIESEKVSGFVDKEQFDKITTTEDPQITADREQRARAASADRARKANEVAAAKQKEREVTARAECTRRGPPKIGMSSDELVASCWGRPLRIVKKTTAAGVQESYIYGAGHIVKLTDGKISEIVEAR